MVRRLTTSQLISNVRGMLDEDNSSNITDESILQALNRAQDVAVNILARQYESPLLTSLPVQPDPGQREFEIPEDALEERLEKLEVRIGNYYQEIPRVSYRDLHNYDYNTATDTPRAYAVIGRNYEVLPTTNGTYPFRIWYLKDPLPLVSEQGRIVGTGADGSSRDYITVDSIGSELTTSSTNLGNYVNLIDGSTGEVKATLQITAIDTSCDRVTFKATPDRTEVLGLTVVGSLPSTIEADDYICSVQGTCVPFFKKPNSNFIMQRATLDIRVNKLNESADGLRQLDSELNQQVERSWVGRAQTLRVKGTNVNWSRHTRRRQKGGS